MAAAAQSRTSSTIVNAISIDVEDYFHVSVFDGLVPRHTWSERESRVSANTERLMKVLDEAKVRGTFFILGWVAQRFPELIALVASQGHEIASHGLSHRLVYDQTPAAFREDVRRAKGMLEQITGAAVHGFRAPSYSITPLSLWAIDILIEEGYAYDASIFPILHDRYGIPVSPRHPYRLERATGALVEIPASTVRVGPYNLPIAGGGYFRILPYAWTRWGIARLNRVEQQPAVFYLHPWEIDPDQPRLSAGLVSRFRHYRNLHKTEERLRKLLQDFRFDTVRDVVMGPAAAAGAPDLEPATLPYVW